MIAKSDPLSVTGEIITSEFFGRFSDRIPIKHAIFLVHCSGNPLNIKEIKRESKKFGLKIIEDCSQAPFAIACRGMCFNKNKN